MEKTMTQSNIQGVARGWPTDIKKNIAYEFFLMSGLFFGSFAAVYLINGVFNYLYFLIPLYFFWKTEDKDYFWFAYFFIIMTQPAFFFAQKGSDAICRLPLYKLGPLGAFVPEDIFLILATVKAFLKGKTRKITVNKSFLYLGIYFFLVSVPITFLFGVEDFHRFLNSIRGVIYYFLLYGFIKLIKDEDELIKFGYLVSPYIFLILFNQFYILKFGKQFVDNYDPQGWGTINNTVTGTVRADVGLQTASILMLYVLIFSLQIKGQKRYELFSGFSDILTAAVILSLFVSATRMLTTVSITMVIIYGVLSEKKQIGRLLKLFAVGAILVLGLQYADVLKEGYIANSLARFNIVFEAVQEKNVGKTDTFQSRLEDDYPRVLSGVAESPLLGVGLSDYYFELYSNDIGIPNTFLLLGGIGAILFLIYYAKITYYYARYTRNFHNSESNRNIACALLAGLCGIVLGYLTTYDFFSVLPNKIFFISILFGTADILNRA